MATELTLKVHRDTTVEFHRVAVERVIREMRSRFAEPFSLHDMAEIACISPFHFDRIFHQTTGIPAVQFLYALRIEAAKRLLLTTPLSVTNVCYEVGYNSIGTFTSRFTQLVGLSPRRFRELAANLTKSILETWCNTHSADSSFGTLITGKITTLSDFRGVIFLGLFASSIPQSYPIAGTLLASTGLYYLGPVPDGRFYLFAAGFPMPQEPIDFFLPDSSSVLVGSSSQLAVNNGKSISSAEMRLRPTQITDPPILISLPYLLAKFEGKSADTRPSKQVVPRSILATA